VLRIFSGLISAIPMNAAHITSSNSTSTISQINSFLLRIMPYIWPISSHCLIVRVWRS
jgi:hypothetical protein